MPGEREVPGTSQDWLARARSDLALAQAPLPAGAVYADLCFHAQQAAEKALKAVYRFHALRFRYTHDLGQLAHGLREQGVSVPVELDAAADLTVFAAEARYPGLGEAITVDEYQRAVAMAKDVVHWAKSVVGNEA